MAYTAPKTWAYKETLSANDLNVYVRDNFIALTDRFCPVGSIREFNVSTNPATLMGFGTWAEYGKGRVTVAINSTDDEFNVLGETSGAKTHTLSEAELATHDHGGSTGNDSPDHNHTYANLTGITDEGDDVNRYGIAEGGGAIDGGTNGASARHTHSISSQGSGAAHNNIQPSIVVYRWVRTA